MMEEQQEVVEIVEIEPAAPEHKWPDIQTLQAAIETILYLCDGPVSLDKLREKIDPTIPVDYLLSGLTELQKTYEQPNHGLRLAQVANGYQFRTRPAYAHYARQVVKTQTLNLGNTALEVLAIIAYKGPISRHDIDTIRGVDSSHILRGLMDKKLVSLHAASAQAPHPTYATTVFFLEFFGLNSLQDLPPEHEIQALIAQSEVGDIKDIKELVSEYQPEDLDKSELEDLDALSKTIRDTISETDFSKELGKNAEQSSFEILEKYTIQQEVIAQNKLSIESVYPFEL